jgi:pimeloyl-ACP methyl ester carboxylesterase
VLLTRLFAIGAVLLATACSATPGAPAPPAAAVAPVPAPPPAVWQPCGNGFDCTRVRVPVDYTRPTGPSIELAVVRHAATDRARRIGTLFVNPGGPGGPVGDFLRALGAPEGPFGAEVVARYDLIGMDPRGVGESAPVVCRDDAERETLLALDADLALPGGLPVPELEALARDLAADCGSRVDPALLGQLSTDVVARDMDQVRLALGEEKIGYYGLSYGTLLGSVYATLFPTRVARMVLDAPVHPQAWLSDPLGTSIEQTVSAEALLNRYFATCAAEAPACSFGNGRPAEAFDALVARLEAAPIVLRLTNRPEIRVDGATLLLAARTAVFIPELWPGLTKRRGQLSGPGAPDRSGRLPA